MRSLQTPEQCIRLLHKPFPLNYRIGRRHYQHQHAPFVMTMAPQYGRGACVIVTYEVWGYHLGVQLTDETTQVVR
jgi:hypothetical protein